MYHKKKQSFATIEHSGLVRTNQQTPRLASEQTKRNSSWECEHTLPWDGMPSGQIYWFGLTLKKGRN